MSSLNRSPGRAHPTASQRALLKKSGAKKRMSSEDDDEDPVIDLISPTRGLVSDRHEKKRLKGSRSK